MAKRRGLRAALKGQVRRTAQKTLGAVRKGSEIVGELADRVEQALDTAESRDRSPAFLVRPEQTDPAVVARLHQAVRKHLDAYLRYEIGLEVARRGLPRQPLDMLLEGGPPVLAAPVLETYVLTRDWPVDLVAAELQEALDVLGIKADLSSRDPRAEASAACQSWAQAEANKRIDAQSG